MAETFNDIPVLFFVTGKEWEQWLSKNFDNQQGVWLKFAKKSTGIESIHHDDALDVALCYGWIDGQARGYDEQYHLQKFTPRRAKSTWSEINVQKVAALIADGRMRAPGLAAIEAAKADGRWDLAYAPQSTATVPPDFQEALDANPQAKAFFETLSKSNRYAFIWRVMTAKRPETRASRIEKFIAMLNNSEAIH